MPEITQGAAILVNPTDINEIAEAIYRFIDDENLRKKMVKMGYEIVKGFSWKETAQKTLKTFEEARLL
jgi:glycosyltransferase involved in cell wall biosynthesis